MALSITFALSARGDVLERVKGKLEHYKEIAEKVGRAKGWRGSVEILPPKEMVKRVGGELGNIFLTVYPSYPVSYFFSAEALEGHLESTENVLVVAFKGDEPIGVGEVVVDYSSPTAEVKELAREAVRKDMQGRGVGKTLVMLAHEAASVGNGKALYIYAEPRTLSKASTYIHHRLLNLFPTGVIPKPPIVGREFVYTSWKGSSLRFPPLGGLPVPLSCIRAGSPKVDEAVAEAPHGYWDEISVSITHPSLLEVVEGFGKGKGYHIVALRIPMEAVAYLERVGLLEERGYHLMSLSPYVDGVAVAYLSKGQDTFGYMMPEEGLFQQGVDVAALEEVMKRYLSRYPSLQRRLKAL